jgi:hypothetical protein
VLVVTLCPLLASGGCSVDRYYADAEDALHTSSYFHALDHIAVYYPSAIALNFPGYIVGFEETERRRVANGRDAVIVNKSAYAAGYTVERLLGTLRFHVPVVSHVLRYEGRPYGEGNCALYSLYHNHGAAIMDNCAGATRHTDAGESMYESAFAGGWDAIDILRERLTEDVDSGNYTHLLVAIMGLDTAQEEAIRNYKSIAWSIKRNGNDAFRPLFVGITWPSFFANRWLDPLWEAFAYSPIADRADILGLSWLGIILNDVISPLSDRIRVTVVAHSFGARAATMSLCVGPAIQRRKGQESTRRSGDKVHDFVALSPAFSVSRFAPQEHFFYENVYYKDYCPKIRRFVFTASENDGAYAPVIWVDMLGDHTTRAKVCGRKQPVTVSCVSATREGRIVGYDASAKISYVDTSALMRFGVPGTDGKAHSDIYRPEIGRLIWAVINGPAN